MSQPMSFSPDELLTTTRAVRKRLDFERPVSLELIRECLEIALQAPTGSNAQGWQWMVVQDAAKRLALAELYRKAWAIYPSMAASAHKVQPPETSRSGALVVTSMLRSPGTASMSSAVSNASPTAQPTSATSIPVFSAT